MAKFGSDKVGFLLVGGFNLLASDVFSLTGPQEEAVIQESTSLGDAWQESLATGIRKVTLAQDGLYDDVATGINQRFTGNQTTEYVACLNFEGNTAGEGFVGLKGVFGSKWSRVAERAGLTKATVGYTCSGPREDGVILHALAARTANGDTQGADSVDNAASTANGGSGYLQVTAYSGFTNVVVKVRHSADDITYADLITFATVTAVTAERATVSGTVNRHLAASWVVTGSGSITFMVGFARG